MIKCHVTLGITKQKWDKMTDDKLLLARMATAEQIDNEIYYRKNKQDQIMFSGYYCLFNESE